ncbi:MAG: MBL fold metallo-hydrolase [Phycisphaerales bacterium]|nr:MBL fold metallo-hydrolase [Phycisphaerales bacterium]
MTMRYHWKLLRAGRLLLDGGGMFGLIPRVVWTRQVSPDDKNRVELHHNCLFLESENEDPAIGRRRRVVIEAGTGDKLDAKMRDIFGLDGRTVETALLEQGIAPQTIDQVICSHLHFDHAGGLTRRVRNGEAPDWVATKPGAASGDDPRVKFTFPNAQLIIQRREWVDARNNDSVMTRTYYRDHILPFEDEHLKLSDGRPRLVLVDSRRPFPLDRKPSRGDVPATSVDERASEVLPGIDVFLVPGHTWGQQAVRFADTQGRKVVFTPDVMPTAWHSGAAYSLAYDVEAYTSMISKRWFLQAAAENDWLLVLDHEPGEPRRRVRDDGKGWWRLEPETA